ncbi:MAG: DNA polymerase I [Nitrospirae bacterium]|nr:DNA polymerase I [Nitrospirota bacterium]
MTERPTLYLIDGNSYIYRAYHAIKGLTNSKGFPTGAIYGFTNMLLKVVREKRPDYIAIAFDSPAPTERHRLFEAYKAQRPSTPNELINQIPYIKKIVDAFRIPILEIEGYEADDILATLAKKGEEGGLDVTIVTGDKDIFQIVGRNIRTYDTMKDKIYEEKDVLDKFGVSPDKVIEVMGLMGDAIDNIPGVPGIGEKTAVELVKEFGSIENLLRNLERVKKPKLRETLKLNEEIARLSYSLATIHSDLPIDIDLKDLSITKPDNETLLRLFKEFEFSSLLKTLTPHADLDKREYSTITSEGEFLKLLERMKEKGEFSIDIESTGKDPMMAEIVGISVSIEPHSACYIPLSHIYPGAPHQLKKEYVLEKLKPILEDETLRKIGQNIKYEVVILRNHGIDLKGISFDTMIASYLLNPVKPAHNLENIALEYLDYKILTYEEVVGKGKKQIGFENVPLDIATKYSCEDSDITLRLKGILSTLIDNKGLRTLFHDVEMPLLEVLADIEMNGFKIDREIFPEMSKELEGQLNTIIERIYFLSGEEFNINSPKQLSEILFKKLGLKPTKRTKTGYSTNVEVLEELSFQHELPREILEYRNLFKIKSTYLDTLPNLINPKTGRIHTSLNQTVTATGRLSSSEPNLQNIPIRGELGKRIREAFIAEKGNILLSADYSQIELRILAHLAQDEILIDAFKRGEDIHTRTATEIFGLPPESITPDMRRQAKTVNFGIIYGMSSYGLSVELGIPPGQAKEIIDRYFETHRGVKVFIERNLKEAEAKGYVTTILCRQRHIPELMSQNSNVRQLGERLAINTPIQGSAADLIKLAMVNISKKFHRMNSDAMMILQIHDELVFESPEEEIEQIKKVVKEEMEGVIEFSVPIKVDIGVGRNWAEAH